MPALLRARHLAGCRRFFRRKTIPLFAGLLLLLAGLPTAAPAAEDEQYFVRTWRVADGLPHNSVSKIVQDARGFLWIATPGGLSRFDGTRFKEYPLPSAPAEANTSVRDLAVENGDSLVMIIASDGVMRFRDGVFSEHPVNRHLRDRPLYSLHVEPGAQVLWVVGENEIHRWTEDSMLTFGQTDGINRRGQRPSFATDEQGRTWLAITEFLGYFEGDRLHRVVHDYGVTRIAPARDGGFWIATRQELIKRTQGILHTVLKDPEWMTATLGLQELFEDDSGVIWTASRRRGLWRLAGGTIVPSPVSHSQAMSVTQDDEGNMWVSTSGGGISRLRTQTFLQLNSSTGLPDAMSTSVCDDVNGTLWCANRSGGLIRSSQGTFTRAGRGLYVNVVSPRPGGGAWVGAQQGLFRIGPGDNEDVELVSRDLRDVRILHTTRSGDLWIASGRDRLGYVRDDQYHPMTEAAGFDQWRVAAITEDAKGRLHIISDSRASYVWNGSRLELDIASEDMPGGLIYSVHADPSDVIWYGTSRGLVIRRGERLQLLSTEQGLPDDMIFQVITDGSGRIWCGSRRGIFSIDREELLAVADGRLEQVNAVAVGRAHGLVGASGLNGLQPMSWRAKDGRVWFATHGGLIGINPATTLPSTAPPRIYLDDVLVDGQSRKAEGALVLGPGEHQVDFHFAALNFSNAENVRMRHRLRGYDAGWIDTDGQRRAHYSRLPAGHYTLEATAANEDGRWNEAAATVSLEVKPWWWQTWWAVSLGVLLSATSIAWLARRWSHRRLKARLTHLEYEHALERERARIARDLHDDLGGSLTKIGMLADRLKRQSADSELKPKLGQLVWHTRRLTGELESIVWTVSPKNNTWDRLAVYIAQFTNAFFRDTPIVAGVSGQDDFPAAPLAPDAQYHVLAILREALNNVLKHSHATSVHVSMSASPGVFSLQIRDNGIGFDPAAPEHTERNGLCNLRARAAELGSKLEIESTPGAGSIITLEVVMNPAPRSQPVSAIPATHP